MDLPNPFLNMQLTPTPFGLQLKVTEGPENEVKRNVVFSNIMGVPAGLEDLMAGPLADYMRGSFAKNFDAQGRPAWDPLSPGYLASRQARGLGDTILFITGELRDEVAGTGSGHVEEVTSNAKTTTLTMGGSSQTYQIHQQGASGSRGEVFASPGKKLRWWGPGGVVHFADHVAPADFTIPARPMVMAQDEDADEMIHIIKRYANEKMGV